MGCLNLTFLLESGAFADFHLICTDSDGVEKKFSVHKNIVFTQCVKIRDLATIAPIKKGSDGVEFAHLEYDPIPFGAVLHFLYSGEYEAESQPATRKRGESERDLHDIPQPLFYSLRALKLAHELEIFTMYEEAASALRFSAEYYTHHVDFPGMVDELYSTCCQHAQFDMYLNRIAGVISENSLVDRRFQDRLKPTMLKHPRLALDVMEAAFEALAETRRELVRAQEEISDMRAQGFVRDEFWAQAERDRQRDREMKQTTADRFEYRVVRGSLKRSPSS
ncbi:uncharacterized protein LY79DRAFT_312106 [Colletotrichum navitas]|uniref:BTB domain-containing protein n=1 Tax=Colletotrichum navitas TaxID=681940 RepID=A0AAD8PUA7_9PEZI|nr:uncharacterized protein LY79DRAFT_312106 [Colletotrichum navitas]KAK1580214.1 hypothetical protein LY79DRAFT_312106 [Colletotrichum navitas]